MLTLDLVIIAAYLAGTIALGAWFSRRQQGLKYYFVSGRNLPWWVVMASIVSTETSAVTFISVPGYAFGADYTFLQLPMGYLVGRLVVSLVFVPAYFRGDVLTVYQLLGERFGGAVKQLASGLFLVTRTLSDGFRLFATALVLAALLVAMPGVQSAARQWLPAADPTALLLVGAVVVLGVAMIVYTFLGGMTALIWTDVVQLGIYLVGAIASAVVLWQNIPGGWHEVSSVALAQGKLRVFDFAFDLTRGYTFWSGLIGGAFLTTATHGTDQFMVQRYLCSDSERSARKALLVSGGFVFVQFALFLGIGTLLYVFYTAHAPTELTALTIDGRVATDRVFPQFIVTHLPPGLTGLVVAAILAAAMSSSLNASAAAAVGDFYMPFTAGRRSETALSQRVAAADRRLRRTANRRRACRDSAVAPDCGRGARHRVVHERPDSRRLPPWDVHRPRPTARSLRGDDDWGRGDARRASADDGELAVVRADRVRRDICRGRRQPAECSPSGDTCRMRPDFGAVERARDRGAGGTRLPRRGDRGGSAGQRRV